MSTQWALRPSSSVNGRSLEPPGLFQELERSGEKGLSKEGDQEPDGRSVRALAFLCRKREPSRRTTIFVAIHQSGLYEGPGRSHSFVKGTWQKTDRFSDHEKPISLVWWDKDWTRWPPSLIDLSQHKHGHVCQIKWHCYSMMLSDVWFKFLIWNAGADMFHCLWFTWLICCLQISSSSGLFCSFYFLKN